MSLLIQYNLDDDNPFAVYLVKCPRGYYCGYSNNPHTRYLQHSGVLKGGARSVKMLGGCQEMRVIDAFPSKGMAMSYEAKVKKMTRTEKLLLWNDGHIVGGDNVGI